MGAGVGARVCSPLGLRSTKVFCLLRVLPRSAGWIERVRSCAGADRFLLAVTGDESVREDERSNDEEKDENVKGDICRERSSRHLEFQLSREQVLVNLP